MGLTTTSRMTFVGTVPVPSRPTERFHAVARQVNPSKAAAPPERGTELGEIPAGPASVHPHTGKARVIVTRRHWTITTHLTGRPRDVDVFLYDKLSHMRGAATKYSKRVDDEPETFPRAAAVTHGFHLYLIDEDGTETEQQRAAIIRLSRTRVTPEIVSHEVAHAAQHLYGLDCLTEDDKAKDHFDSANEKFAYLLGDLFAAVWSLVNEEDSNGD